MSLEDILIAIEKPLSFAAKNNFASLPHIINLSEIVAALADKGLSETSDYNHQDLLSKLKSLFSAYSASHGG